MVTNVIITGDVREVLQTLPDQSVHCCVTSPPYWGLRDYGVDGQLGLEQTPEEYVANMVDVFREVRRVLRDDGTLWLNLGDSYWANRSMNGLSWDDSEKHKSYMLRAGNKSHPIFKPKDLVGIPWRVAFALQEDGWYLRSDIVWNKPNTMPESVNDRPTKAHEYIFLMSKSPRYYYDFESIKENAVNGDPNQPRGSHGVIDNPLNGGRRKDHTNDGTYQLREKRNKRSVWTVSTKPFSIAHFATFPEELIQPCILAGCPVGGTVLDPFFGSGTTGLASVKLDRKYIGIEINPEYVELARDRLRVEESQVRLGLFVSTL